MNIQILDSWLREYLKTNATPKDLARELSLSSASIERIDHFEGDFIYDIEVTTNRPDLMSVVGIAKEAAAILPQIGIGAEFIPPVIELPKNISNEATINITNDSKLINRICAVVMEVHPGKSPEKIRKRLISSGIRSLNNVIDVTNYVMREMGHPSHVFDFDRISGGRLSIRTSQKGERVTTLDGKTYSLPGGDIVAEDGSGKIVDLIGIMGLENSVVTPETKKILFFIDNNNPHLIRKISMSTGIRTEAAILNEKNVDPELAYLTLLRGIKLFEEIAEGKTISKIIDIYPNKIQIKPVTLSYHEIDRVIGVKIEPRKVNHILTSLGFSVNQTGVSLTVTPSSGRAKDLIVPEDVIEEVARIYGYYKIPTRIPSISQSSPYNPLTTPFYWEGRTKEFFKYRGWDETYTYSMIPEEMLEEDPEKSVKIANPLNEELVYMRTTLVPSLLEVVRENRHRETIRIFEIAKTYHKNSSQLPEEIMKLAGVLKETDADFFKVKGLLEALCDDLGINSISFKIAKEGDGAEVLLNKIVIGEIEILDQDVIDFELNFDPLINLATHKKIYRQISKFPPLIEDLNVIIGKDIPFEKIISTITSQSHLITNVELIDKFEEKKTFRITYQNPTKNLTTQDVVPIREKILKALKSDLHAEFT